MIGLAELARADEVNWRSLMGAVLDAAVIGNNDGGGISAEPDKGATLHFTPVQESLDE